MRRLLIITLSVILITSVFAESPHGDDLKIDCAVCHTTDNWTKIKPNGFNHDSTGFKLNGQHKAVSCKKCHEDLLFQNAKNECISCHIDVHQQTLGRDCERCHTTNSWIVGNITEIHRQSRFPLLGKHAQIDCYDCHKSASLHRYDPMKTECNSCHLNDYNSALNPNHITSRFPTDCDFCHNQSNWQSATFNHNTTSFPLRGGHIGVECNRCHSGGYTGTSTLCVSCHQANYNATTNPNHITAKFSTDCKTCHNETAWQPSTFNHNTNTSFPLTGGHLGVDCIKCHASGFTGTSALCVSCHQQDYNATTNPNHVTAKFSTDCKTCHNVTAWQPSTFNHNINTSFPLTGGHLGVDCIKCHASGYTGTSTLCVSCHQSNYNATTNPNHITAKFSTDCKTCHNETAWQPSTFNHNINTSFPLTGGHIGVDCIKCHASGYTGTSTLCMSCHQSNYNATTNPNHITAKFSTDCKTCHNETAWQPSTFNHNTNTSFPLTGGHLGVDCIKCHASGYTGTSTACVSCHLTDYNSTKNPAHATAKFPTNCESCHNKVAWVSSTFNHDTQYFRIYSGRHREQWSQCSECHINPTNFATFSCIVCHEHSNKASVDADHSGENDYVYSATSCLPCHQGV